MATTEKPGQNSAFKEIGALTFYLGRDLDSRAVAASKRRRSKGVARRQEAAVYLVEDVRTAVERLCEDIKDGSVTPETIMADIEKGH